MKQLAKYHNQFAVELVGATWEFQSLPGYNGGWVLLNNTDPTVVVGLSETYFDLAGMAMDDKTIMTDAIAVQEAYFPTLSQNAPGGAGDQVWIYDLITSIPIGTDAADWAKVYLGGAGFPSVGILNFEHILYQRVRRFTSDLDHAGFIAIKAGDEQSGSLSPSASDRLYSYRLVVAYNVTGNLIGASTPAARHLIAASVKEEPQYEYLMRLMRSYQLQQQPDVD
jgi:hypothetical protein